MNVLYENLAVYMLIGVVIIVGVSQVNRIIGAAIALPFWTAVGFVGINGIDAGYTLKLGNIELSKLMLLGICGFMILMNTMIGYAAHMRNKRSASGSDDYQYD